MKNEELSFIETVDKFMSNYDPNLMDMDVTISIFGKKVTVESIWHNKEEKKIYLHCWCSAFEGDIDIESISDRNQRRIKKNLELRMK